tara:strand:- start:568 stop:849 length:282 start_codon:yes stop_codon:yes gene_type:complete
MKFFDALSQLGVRLSVAAFGGLIALLISIHVLSAIDWLWFLPDIFRPAISMPTLPAPPPGPSPQPASGCIAMPDGTLVCDGPVPERSARSALR